jgi:hypothetical protein
LRRFPGAVDAFEGEQDAALQSLHGDILASHGE